MKPNPIKDKSFAFAVRIVNVYKYLSETKREFVLSKQLLRSGTAVGALYREAEQAESKADFVHKLAIAQKECNETLYWLELIQASEFIDKTAFDSIYSEALELMKLLTSIIKTTKNNG
ncbi:MAG: four helix bundle protein [Bacteroidales bacterium]|nr:four helix bundle protein [Bacteroidales bacterium]